MDNEVRCLFGKYEGGRERVTHSVENVDSSRVERTQVELLAKSLDRKCEA